MDTAIESPMCKLENTSIPYVTMNLSIQFNSCLLKWPIGECLMRSSRLRAENPFSDGAVGPIHQSPPPSLRHCSIMNQNRNAFCVVFHILLWLGNFAILWDGAGRWNDTRSGANMKSVLCHLVHYNMSIFQQIRVACVTIMRSGRSHVHANTHRLHTRHTQ